MSALSETHSFSESRLLSAPLRELGLAIAGSPLEPVLAEFQAEIEAAGFRWLKPHFYLSTEWGVPFGSVSIAIPFYLSKAELAEAHAQEVGYLEGANRADLLRYLRHELGHVVCYAYKLYEREEWVKLFGPLTQPYHERFRPQPFSRRFVRHLPGWYAQKHPEEDWAETFAVWMTPGSDWRTEYAEWRQALAKLEWCDRIMADVKDAEPLVSVVDPDEEVSAVASSAAEQFVKYAACDDEPPPGLDGALRAIFEDLSMPENPSPPPRRPAAALIRKLERELVANIHRWTGHFPEPTRQLIRKLAERADELRQVYPDGRETAVAIAVTALVASLAMNYVQHGSYLPSTDAANLKPTAGSSPGSAKTLDDA